METQNSNNLINLKQPKPTFQNENSQTKTISKGIGVVQLPQFSNTPELDEYVKKREETPKIKYKEIFKKNKFLTTNNILSLSVITAGFISLLQIPKGIKSIFKK